MSLQSLAQQNVLFLLTDFAIIVRGSTRHFGTKDCKQFSASLLIPINLMQILAGAVPINAIVLLIRTDVRIEAVRLIRLRLDRGCVLIVTVAALLKVIIELLLLLGRFVA